VLSVVVVAAAVAAAANNHLFLSDRLILTAMRAAGSGNLL
jgi:hypothetical protein